MSQGSEVAAWAGVTTPTVIPAASSRPARADRMSLRNWGCRERIIAGVSIPVSSSNYRRNCVLHLSGRNGGPFMIATEPRPCQYRLVKVRKLEQVKLPFLRMPFEILDPT